MKYKKVNEGFSSVPLIGQGTMGMGGFLSKDTTYDFESVKSLRLGIEIGMTFVDTAESYGAGHSEELVGKAVKGMRKKVFIATKFSPENNNYKKVLQAAERSLERLNTDYIDLYQVHWPNPQIPIEETMAAMEDLVKQGKVKYIGISNFSLEQMKEAQRSLRQNKLFSTEMEYNLFDRFIEKNILPYCEKEKIITVAYSPLDQGRIVSNEENKLKVLQSIARKYKKTVSQIVLNWLVLHPTVIAIPKATEEKYIKENALAADFEISKEDFNEIARIYTNETTYVPTEEINVSTTGQGNRRVYQTITEAIENKLSFVPSPTNLAQYIKNHSEEEIKPVRLVPAQDSKFKYDLIEGRVRYWAWVIAQIRVKNPFRHILEQNFNFLIIIINKSN